MRRGNRLLVFLLVVSIFLFSCQTLANAPSIIATEEPTLPPATAEPKSVLIESPATSLPTISETEIVTIDSDAKEEILVEIYEKANPGVVAIQVLTESGNAAGSGFVFDEEGHIITNFHVVDGITDLEVDFPNGYKVRGEVIGEDLDSDLAVIKVEVPPDVLHPLPLGDSSKLKIGQTVVAIGSPFRFNGSMTTGIISSLGRTLDSIRTAPGGDFFTAGDLIQTDAAINPGNSGGPLLNLNGEVIGINRAIRTFNFTSEDDPLNSGIGFAIAINIVKRVAPSLINDGFFDYPYLGISSIDDISLLQQEALRLPQANGAYISSVSPDSPADEAGLRGGTIPTDIFNLNAGGDLIIAIDGRPVETFSNLLSYLIQQKSPGDVITLTVLRDDEEIDLELTLGKRP
jgi:2-alkenal reductase